MAETEAQPGRNSDSSDDDGGGDEMSRRGGVFATGPVVPVLRLGGAPGARLATRGLSQAAPDGAGGDYEHTTSSLMSLSLSWHNLRPQRSSRSIKCGPFVSPALCTLQQ